MIRLQAWSQSRAHCVEEQDEEERLSDVQAVDEEEMLPGSIMNREKSVSESTSREVGIVRT